MLSLYNTLTRKVEKFKPLKGKKVGLYTCGPTVYDFAHIGNLRTYVFEDILRRTLEWNGYRVNHVMNITDIDDKIIQRSLDTGEKMGALTTTYTKAFLQDLKKLGILKPTKMPSATKHVKEMIALVQVLIKKGLAYEKDGSVYFSVQKFKQYGKLSQLDKRELKLGVSLPSQQAGMTDDYDKENAQDFVLWKASKPNEPVWKAPFGNGRPGWHLECSAMSMKYLGKSFDIHAGAVDLIFPHHENEIAQSEGVTGKPFAKLWVHGEHLMIDGAKMSKSAHNFFTLADLEAKGFSPLVYRYFLLGAHYRSKINCTDESLRAAQSALERLYDTVRAWSKPKKISARYMKLFTDRVNDDLDMPGVLALLWQLVKDEKLSSAEKAATLMKFDAVLGLNLKQYIAKPISIPATVTKLVKAREAARAAKDWKKSDELREEIKKSGFEVFDTPDGPQVKRR